MHVIDEKELNDLLSSFLFTIHRMDIYYRSMFESLYATGLRFNEFKQFRRWKVVNNESFNIQTLKGGAVRNVKFSELPQHVVESYFAASNNYDLINNSTACYYLKNYFGVPTVRTLKNTVKTHLFRHNKIKQMAASGYSRLDIGAYIGEVDLKNIDWYVNSVLYYY